MSIEILKAQKINVGKYICEVREYTFIITRAKKTSYPFWEVTLEFGPFIGEIKFNDSFTSLGEAKNFCSLIADQFLKKK